GFDAMTGALNRIDIRGRDGKRLRDKWEAGPRTYLGLAVGGFPNLFIVTGPGSPSVLSNMMTSIEQHVEWISDCLEHLRRTGAREIEASVQAEEAWVGHVNDLASKSLRPSVDSWYVGSNIPGKPRVFMPYLGGADVYRQKCDHVAATGYDGFAIG
ncbi:MAG: cyclohexanone monooxygenase, partial [Bauldia litoralis]